MGLEELTRIIRQHSETAYPFPHRWLAGKDAVMECRCDCGEWIPNYRREEHIAKKILEAEEA